uniref:Uncharacterized protein n=1 Tax=Anopheles coluzzii TaxID=1518534 RepID=A0A8W7P6L3_ANOCL
MTSVARSATARELSLDLKPFPCMNPTSQDLSELRVSDFLLQLSSSGTPTCSSEYHRLLLLLFVYSPGQWCSCSCGVILVVVVVVMVVVLCLAVTVGRRTVLSTIDSWLMVETAGGTDTNDCEPVRDGAAIVFASRGTRLVSASNRLRRGSSVTGKGSSERLSRSSAASGDRPPLAPYCCTAAVIVADVIERSCGLTVGRGCLCRTARASGCRSSDLLPSMVTVGAVGPIGRWSSVHCE